MRNIVQSIMQILALLVSLLLFFGANCSDQSGPKLRVHSVLTGKTGDKEVRARHQETRRKFSQQDENAEQIKQAESAASISKDASEQFKRPTKEEHVPAAEQVSPELGVPVKSEQVINEQQKNVEVENGGVKNSDSDFMTFKRDGETIKVREAEQRDGRMEDLVAAFRLSDSDADVVRQAEMAGLGVPGNAFIGGGPALGEKRNGRLPTFVDAGDGSFRIVGGPEPDSGTMSIVVIFCFVALLVIAVIFMQQRAAVLAPQLRLEAAYGRPKARGKDVRGARSPPPEQARFDSNSFELNVDDEGGFFAARKRLQPDSEGVRSATVAPSAPQDEDSGSDYGKLNDDAAALAGFSEDESVGDDTQFDYRTVEDEVDELEGEDSDTGSAFDPSAASDPLHPGIPERDADADWSLDDDSDSESDTKKKKKRWSFW